MRSLQPSRKKSARPSRKFPKRRRRPPPLRTTRPRKRFPRRIRPRLPNRRRKHRRNPQRKSPKLPKQKRGKSLPPRLEASKTPAAGDDKGTPAPAGEDDKAKTPGAEPAAAPTERAPFVPIFKSDAKIDEINTQLADLDKKLTEGELDIVEYNNKRDALIEARTEARMTAKFNAQSAEQLWQHEQRIFFEENAPYRSDPVLNGALANVFRQLEGQEENRAKSGLQLLNEAKAEVEKRLSAFGGKGAETGKEGADKSTRSALDKAEIPKTLGSIPAADASETGQDEFAYLDKLEGIEYEKALSKLTKDQEQRYLRGRTD